MKRKYKTPLIIDLGSAAELTAGGSSRFSETVKNCSTSLQYWSNTTTAKPQRT